MDIPWDDVRLFLAIADAQSLSAAARKLKVAQPTVSRRLAELEAHLAEPLFLRSVEGVSLTPFGERLLPPARNMAEWSAELERAADRAETLPRGVVRITAPPGIAFDFLAPFAADLRKTLPEVRLEVVSSIHYLDLGRREADLALRFERPAQRDLVTLASLPTVAVFLATREYLRSLPRGYRLADVGFVAWAPPLEHLAPNPQLAARIPGFRPVFASDDFLVQLRATLAGAGAMLLARLPHRFAIDSGLEEVAVDIGRIPAPLHLVAARSALEIPRVKAVAELLVRDMEHAERKLRRGGSRRNPGR